MGMEWRQEEEEPPGELGGLRFQAQKQAESGEGEVGRGSVGHASGSGLCPKNHEDVLTDELENVCFCLCVGRQVERRV